jgi:hypothetical protein
MVEWKMANIHECAKTNQNRYEMIWTRTYQGLGTWSLSSGQGGQGVALTTHPHLVPRLKKEYSLPLLPL